MSAPVPVSVVESPSYDSYDVTLCTLCSQLYNDPVLLPCLHTFCAECLRRCSAGISGSHSATRPLPAREADSENTQVVCPLCRRTFCGGLESLPTNTFIEKAARLRRLEEKRRAKQLSCSACCRHPCDASVGPTGPTGVPRSVGPTADGAAYCVECDDTLCAACCSAHRKLRITEPHHLVELSDCNFTDKVEKLMMTLTPPCRLHPNQLRSLYCREAGCSTTICSNCAVKTHRTHDFVDIGDVTATHRAALLSSVGTIASTVERVTKDRDQVRTVMCRLNNSVKKTEQEIAKRAAELNQVAAKKCQDLREIVSYFHLDQIGKLDRVQGDVNREKEIGENVMTLCRELATLGSDVEVCDLAKMYISRARQLLLNESDVRMPKPVSLTFVPSNDLETAFGSQPEKMFGTLETLREAKVMPLAEER